MKKSIQFVLLCLGLAFLLSSCKSQFFSETVKETESVANANVQTQTQNMENSNSIKAVYIEHLEDTMNWPGKSLEDVSLSIDPEEQSIMCEGVLFGAKTEGRIRLKTENDRRTVEHISLYAQDSSVHDFYTKMMDLYGGPVDQGEEPYAMANGGALEWYVFDGSDVLVRISQGSENSYVEIYVQVNPEPKPIEKLALRASTDNDSITMQLGVFIKVVSYEDGILTVAITNQSGADDQYSDTFILAKQTENGNGYTYMTQMGNINMAEQEPNTYSIADTETQELKLDLRAFGKVYPGKYEIILNDMEAYFELLPENDAKVNSPADHWFCSECGKKNEDVEFCIECDAQRN